MVKVIIQLRDSTELLWKGMLAQAPDLRALVHLDGLLYAIDSVTHDIATTRTSDQYAVYVSVYRC